MEGALILGVDGTLADAEPDELEELEELDELDELDELEGLEEPVGTAIGVIVGILGVLHFPLI